MMPPRMNACQKKKKKEYVALREWQADLAAMIPRLMPEKTALSGKKTCGWNLDWGLNGDVSPYHCSQVHK